MGLWKGNEEEEGGSSGNWAPTTHNPTDKSLRKTPKLAFNDEVYYATLQYIFSFKWTPQDQDHLSLPPSLMLLPPKM